MDDKKISELTEYIEPIDSDLVAIVDITTSETKKITFANFIASLVKKTQLYFPFWISDGSQISISLTSDFKLPFWISDGSSLPISLIS
jgi:hypothetical protein